MSLINYLTKIHFADDVLEEALRAETRALLIGRPLVVADHNVISSGLIERILDLLPGRAAGGLFGCRPDNASEADCRRAGEAYRSDECDGLIAVGSGAAIDLAKATAILVSHDGPLLRYVAAEGGIARIRNVLPPIIAVPTTAGAGAEVARSAALVFEGGSKLELVSPFLIPKVAICDPTLTLGLSPLATAHTGMDALTHCIETYLATAYNPPADAIALDGVKRAAANIVRAVDKGSDINARREMMAAAMSGALALQKGLGGVHAMTHALEGLNRHPLHHGVLNAILLPHVIEFNAPAVAHRYEAVHSAMRARGARADLALAIQALGASVGLPARLSELGLDRAAIALAAPIAEKDHTNSTNPRRAGAGDYLKLMNAAL